MLVEAAWHAARTAGPLRALHERLAARRGANIATVAVARKLVVIVWHLLTRGESYAFVRPSLYREKLRRLQLMLGAERQRGRRLPTRAFVKPAQRRAEMDVAAQHETAYRRLVADRRAAGPGRRGAGATPGRASQRPSRGEAARQATSS